MATPPTEPTGAALERKKLTEEVLGYIEAGVDTEVPDFNGSCLRMFALHYEVNPIFREFCDAKKVRPGDVSRWQDVPMVYNDMFKTHLVASFPLEQAEDAINALAGRFRGVNPVHIAIMPGVPRVDLPR